MCVCTIEIFKSIKNPLEHIQCRLRIKFFYENFVYVMMMKEINCYMQNDQTEAIYHHFLSSHHHNLYSKTSKDFFC